MRILKENIARPLKELLQLLPNRTKHGIHRKAWRLALKRPYGFSEGPVNNFKSISTVKKLTLFERGRIATLIDSEGSIMLELDKKNKCRPAISVANTCLTLLKKARSITGVGCIVPKRRKMKKTWSPAWNWNVWCLVDIKALLSQVVKFLIVKKERAVLVLQFCDLRIRKIMAGLSKYGEAEYDIYRRFQKLKRS
jgi:hypothetical protein